VSEQQRYRQLYGERERESKREETTRRIDREKANVNQGRIT
jgi:hypothetical protein